MSSRYHSSKLGEIAVPISTDAADRFRRHVKTSGPNDCWEWQAQRNHAGYGIFHYDGRQQRAHRIALAIATGIAPAPGMFACHRCDNPACVNPAHLFVGSPADNTRDAIGKGRFVLPAGPHYNSRKSACMRGHPLSGDNLVTRADGRRACRQCHRDRKQLKRRVGG